MIRRIRSRTLSGVLASYVTRFPVEASEEAAENDPAAGAELLALLPPKQAWQMVDQLPAELLTAWIKHTDDPALARLVKNTGLHQLTRLWRSVNPQQRERILKLVAPEVGAELKALPTLGAKQA